MGVLAYKLRDNHSTAMDALYKECTAMFVSDYSQACQVTTTDLLNEKTVIGLSRQPEIQALGIKYLQSHDTLDFMKEKNAQQVTIPPTVVITTTEKRTTTESTTTTTTPPPPLLCSVDFNAALNASFPPDKTCDILIYTHVIIEQRKIVAMDNEFSYGAFKNACKLYTDTTCGISFDVRYVSQDMFGNTDVRDQLATAKTTSRINHYAIMNIYETKELVAEYTVQATLVFKKTMGCRRRIEASGKCFSAGDAKRRRTGSKTPQKFYRVSPDVTSWIRGESVGETEFAEGPGGRNRGGDVPKNVGENDDENGARKRRDNGDGQPMVVPEKTTGVSGGSVGPGPVIPTLPSSPPPVVTPGTTAPPPHTDNFTSPTHVITTTGETGGGTFPTTEVIATTTQTTTTTTRPPPLLCSVTFIAALNISFPPDKACDILIYTHVLVEDRKIVGLEGEFSYGIFKDSCKLYTDTTCGLSFDIRNDVDIVVIITSILTIPSRSQCTTLPANAMRSLNPMTPTMACQVGTAELYSEKTVIGLNSQESVQSLGGQYLQSHDTLSFMKEKATIVMKTPARGPLFTWFLFSVHLTDVTGRCLRRGPFKRLKGFREFYYEEAKWGY
ncbi:hypothetical protein V5799_029388 [Amblyomma americanum]|uniref:Uncharacterized protein n=1 Tax=Amblyomma americanum TaxID=6943 RepID=A0AAQ4ERC3_AMBAM